MTAAFEEDAPDDLVPEDWPTFYTRVPVWVLLSGCTAQAYRLYAFLAEHINSRTPGRRIAWPKGEAIARALKDYRKAARYWAELQDLGAIRIEEVRYAGGMRRRNGYHVRFNPPAGYDGLHSLSDFYTAHADVRAPRTAPRQTSHGEETAGHPRGPLGVTGGALGGTAQPDQHQLHPEQPENPAPPARSAPNARRAPAPSRRSDAGGVAASGNAPAPHTSAPPRSPRTTPPPQTSTLPRAQREDLRRIEAALPAELRDLLPARRPRPLRQAMLVALAQRTWTQLAERAERRWYAWGFAAAADAATGGTGLSSPVGVAITLLQDGACPDPRCEDGTNIDTGRTCPRCAESRADRRPSPTTASRHAATRADSDPPPRAAAPADRQPCPPPPTAPSPPPSAPAACPGWDATPCGRNAPSTGGMCTRCRMQALHSRPAESSRGTEPPSNQPSHST
ncbi:hypothetical protein [Streptomyces longisporoflavus]|uniref:Helix-turn-helix domain-containing protein n=1 Tax=Streptomyces longisporoflavus TaxID=28044 RepID=A0ABW7R2U0_9ACTN